MTTNSMDDKAAMPKDINQVEHCEVVDGMDDLKQTTTMGTVTINDTEEIILVPAPSADPRGIIQARARVQVISS